MDETKRPAFNGRDDGPAPNAEPETDYQPHGELRDPADEVVVSSREDGPVPDDGDADLLPAGARRLWNRWTIGLVAAALMVAAFGVGAFAQRQTGTDTSPAAAAFPQAGTGGFGGGQLPSTGQGQSGQGGTGQGSTGGTPVVVGQVVSVSGNAMTVKNIAGATVKVTLPAGTTVSVTSSTPLSGLQAGTTVSVTGTRGSDGTVKATGVTAREAAK